MKNKGAVYIVGASGHGKVVASTLKAIGYTIVAFLDDNRDLHGQQWFGYPVVGNSDMLQEIQEAKAVIAIGDAAIRQKVVEKLKNIQWVSAVHPNAFVDESVKIKEGSVVFAGAVIQPGTSIGRHCIINTGATIDHDCCLGDYVHVCPGVNLAGNVTIGNALGWVLDVRQFRVSRLERKQWLEQELP